LAGRLCICLRRYFATYLDRAQGITKAVSPGVIDELMGHKKETLALSMYSGGLRMADLRKAVDAPLK
jgi:integrase